MHALTLAVLTRRVRFECLDPEPLRLLSANFECMVAADEDAPADILYRVEHSKTSAFFSITRANRYTRHAASRGEFLYLVESDLVVALQEQRPELFFLHAAAVDWRGRGYLFAGESGGGKSTTAWALLHHGFGYLSDELSPIELGALRVLPYPHSLCLKQMPAAPYVLPPEAIDLRRTLHVATNSMPSATVKEATPIGAVFLLDERVEGAAPTIRTIQPAEAAARLYATALNALAHPRHGLDAAVQIAERVPCFALSAAALPATCALVQETLRDVRAPSR